MTRLCDFVSLHDSCSMLRHGLVCDLSEMSGGVLWASARKGFSIMTQRQLSTVSLGEESADITESSFLMLMLHASGMRGHPFSTRQERMAIGETLSRQQRHSGAVPELSPCSPFPQFTRLLVGPYKIQLLCFPWLTLRHVPIYFF